MIKKLVYALVNGSKVVYGPERIARTNLKASKECGGINGIDVETFFKSIAVKQYCKAFNKDRVLKALQTSVDSPRDEVSVIGVTTMRENYRKFASNYSLPNLSQLELISDIPLLPFLVPYSNAARLATQEAIESLGTLQIFFSNARLPRARLNVILKSLPRCFATLIRSNSLLNMPTQVVWFGESSISKAELLPTKVFRQTLLAGKFPVLKVGREKIYKRGDWPSRALI